MNKQVVPQVVADYISKEKDGGYTLYGAFTFMAQCTKEVPSPDYYTGVSGTALFKRKTGVSETALFKRKSVKVHKWVIDGHQNAFALAWINGYKVGEQLYYVWFLKDDEESFLNISATDRMVYSREDDRNDYRTKFTMAEIEAIDQRYKAFAIPVEEVDNENN